MATVLVRFLDQDRIQLMDEKQVEEGSTKTGRIVEASEDNPAGYEEYVVGTTAEVRNFLHVISMV